MQNGHIIGSGQPPAFDYKKLIKEATMTTEALRADSIAKPATSTFTLDEDF